MEDNMESINNENQFSSLKENKIMGEPDLTNSLISFYGKNNILYCEKDVNIVNSNIRFLGNNSLVYLSSSKSAYPLILQIFNNSLFYIGKDCMLSPTLSINVQEQKHIVIGDECVVGSNVDIRTSDPHVIYDCNTKKRINHSKSVYIGDHVMLGQKTYIGKGTFVGSGSILDNNTYAVNVFLKSNNLYWGNPVRILKKEVFFTNDYVGGFMDEDTLNHEDYVSRIYLYENSPGETLDINKIDDLLSNFNVDEKLDFVKKLFIQNKKHNRFTI